MKGSSTSSEPEKKTGLRRKDMLFPFLEFLVGAGFFGAAAEVLDDYGFDKPKVLAHCVGLIVMELAVAHFLVRAFRRRAKVIWGVCGVIGILEVIAFTILPVERATKTQPTPHTNATLVLVNVPVDPLEFRQKHEGMELLLGTAIITLPPVTDGRTYFKDIGRPLGIATRDYPSQMILLADENNFVLNIKFAPVFGMPPLVLSNNTLSGMPSKWDCNYSAKGIEIVTESLTPIFQMYYKDDAHLVLQGAITFTNSGILGVCMVGSQGVEVMVTKTLTWNDITNEIEKLQIKRIFKYPAWQHRGQYAD